MKKSEISTQKQFDLYEKLHSIKLKTILFFFLIIVTIALLVFFFFNHECDYKNYSIGIIISTIMFGFRSMVLHFFDSKSKDTFKNNDNTN